MPGWCSTNVASKHLVRAINPIDFSSKHLRDNTPAIRCSQCTIYFSSNHFLDHLPAIDISTTCDTRSNVCYHFFFINVTTLDALYTLSNLSNV